MSFDAKHLLLDIATHIATRDVALLVSGVVIGLLVANREPHSVDHPPREEPTAPCDRHADSDTREERVCSTESGSTSPSSSSGERDDECGSDSCVASAVSFAVARTLPLSHPSPPPPRGYDRATDTYYFLVPPSDPPPSRPERPKSALRCVYEALW